MKMVVVGGSSKNVGKTAVAAGIISALRHRNWVAIKLTQFGDGPAYAEDHEGHCTPEDVPFSIQEERSRDGATDSSRFLVAGARRSFWVRVRSGLLHKAIPPLRQLMEREENVIVESNSILRYFQPNVYLSVLEPAQADFKASARELLGRADAFLLLDQSLETSRWEGISTAEILAKPVFFIQRDCYVTPEIACFVETRLRNSETARYLSS